MKRSLLFCTVVCCLFLFSKFTHAEIEVYDVESYFYYLPYYTSLNGYGTGVALRNCGASGAPALVDIYDNNGNLLTTESKWIESAGQTAFIAGKGLNKEGWMMVSSTSPLAGLCFIATSGSDNHMADISLISELSTEFVVPHVAQNATWDTTIMVCNPHNTGNWVTLSYWDVSGVKLYSQNFYVQANGSFQCELSDLVQGSYANGGSVVIYADEEVAAFALYKNTKTGAYSYAGISAVNFIDTQQNLRIEHLEGTYVLNGLSFRLDTGETLTQDDYWDYSGTLTISQDGTCSQTLNLGGNEYALDFTARVLNNTTLILNIGGIESYVYFTYHAGIFVPAHTQGAGVFIDTLNEVYTWEQIPPS